MAAGSFRLGFFNRFHLGVVHCGPPPLTLMGDPMRKDLKFAAGVGVVLAVIFLIAAMVEPFVGELKAQSILVPVNAVGVAILAIAAALGFLS